MNLQVEVWPGGLLGLLSALTDSEPAEGVGGSRVFYDRQDQVTGS